MLSNVRFGALADIGIRWVLAAKRASVDGAPLARVFSWSFAGWPLAGISSAC